MKKILFSILSILNIIFSYSYPINIGPHSIYKSGGYNRDNVCLLNFNNVYSTF
jgi:hypothetical protein